MAIAAGSRFGAYEVTGSLGAGGMGEVYRARDTRLGRTVAIKVLPPALASDPQRRRRLEQEARAVSALNHPHICALYDIGSEDGADFLVMEYLEGQTLADRLAKGPLPLAEAVEHAAHIADALGRAHRNGIVHRDVKPGNVMLTRDGAKLLDFGLARPRSAGASLDATVTRTLTVAPLTQEGLVVGTVPYMAPEQLEGREADARSDIFSFGVVLYEMVAGHRPFDGESQASVIAQIMTADPRPLRDRQPVTPGSLDRLLRKCLAKDPDKRWQSAADVALQLEGIAEELRTPSSSTDGRVPATPAPSRRRTAAWLFLGALALASLGAGAYAVVQRTSARPQPTFHRLTFRQGSIATARFTPDGQTVIYTARWEGKSPETFTVRVDGVDSEPRDTLKGLNVGAVSSRNEIALFRGGGLAVAPFSGGAPRELAAQVGSADWSPDGTQMAVTRRTTGGRGVEYPLGKMIYRSSNPELQVSDVRVSPTGDLLTFLEHESRHGFVVVIDSTGKKRIQSSFRDGVGSPAWSPDGKEVWFSSMTPVGTETVRALDLSGRERTVLRSPGLELLDVSRNGRVLLINKNAVISIFGRGPGDATERNLTYYGWSLLEDLSPDGRTVLFTEGGESDPENAWSVFTRPTDGSPPQAIGRGHYAYGKLSPDGKWAAVNTFTEQGGAVALVPTGAGEERLITKHETPPARVFGWLPDSSAVLFQRQRRVWLAPLDGVPRPITPEGWFVTGGSTGGVFKENVIAPDGRHFLCGNALPDDYWLYLCEIDAPVSTALPRLVDLNKWAARGWTPDGKRLRVHDWTPGIARHMFLLDPATGAAQPWKVIGDHVDPAGVIGINRLYFSADGESYAYQIQRQLATLYVAEGVK